MFEFEKNGRGAKFINEVVDMLPQAVFWKDKTSVFRGCNKAFAKIVGLKDTRSVVGKKDNDLPWTDQERLSYLNDDRAVMRSGIPKLNYEETQTLKNGKLTVGLVNKIPLRDDNELIYGLLCTYIDITDWKEKEEKLKVSKEFAEYLTQVKSRFIMSLSHDIRTPLSSIQALALSLKETVKSKENQKNIELLLESIHVLSDFLEGITDLVQSELKDTKVVREIFSLEQCIKSYRNLFFAEAKIKNVSIRSFIHADAPDYVFGGHLLVSRVLLNLVSNAVKFTKAGFVKIHLKSILPKDWIQIIVEDTGKGIPLHEQERIFECFSRLSPSYKNIYPGNGLGLYNVQKYVRLLGGHVRVESEVGKGSRFIVSLPLPSIDPPAQLLEKERMPIVRKALKTQFMRHSPHILLVEDNFIGAKVTMDLLRNLNCIVVLAKNGEEAVEKVKEATFYDLILMDIGLPGISGAEATKKIRLLANKNKAATPIVGLTAHLQKKDYQAYCDGGMQAVLQKPLDIFGVNDTLLNVLKRHGYGAA